MADVHALPLLSHDLQWPVAKAVVRKDQASGLWHWRHQCAHRLPGRPFYAAPVPDWGTAQWEADFHARLCTAS
jgi:hypothetical protein